MSLSDLIALATDKKRFSTLEDYIAFCSRYLEFVEEGLQARIISKNENHYQFFQYKEDGSFNISRPLNSRLMYEAESFEHEFQRFKQTLEQIKEDRKPPDGSRLNLICTIYTIQQSIGAALDALPAGMSNQARKINGDLFERLIRLLIVSLGIDCVSGTMQVPVRDTNGVELLKSSYQHDLLLKKDGADIDKGEEITC